MTLHDVSLDDKFDLAKDRVFVSGVQARCRKRSQSTPCCW